MSNVMQHGQPILSALNGIRVLAQQVAQVVAHSVPMKVESLSHLHHPKMDTHSRVGQQTRIQAQMLDTLCSQLQRTHKHRSDEKYLKSNFFVYLRTKNTGSPVFFLLSLTSRHFLYGDGFVFPPLTKGEFTFIC